MATTNEPQPGINERMTAGRNTQTHTGDGIISVLVFSLHFRGCGL